MDQQQQQLVERIRQAQNILVTVSTNPNVDQLSAAIALALVLNKLDKHATAVFSGEVPSTIEFLKPEDTLEKNTDSLRDFIIALDKGKADKLRYKVEDQVVRIFITPYKTSISEKDLDFSQGDFNVDVVVALGVTEQQDLDTAITAHGRILHDATVASLSTGGKGSLGSINWVDTGASSLSEMVVSLVDALDKKAMDGQIATALLTGIVASTERFRNDKTSPKTMSASAELMAAGANQQLIASKLETGPVSTSTTGSPKPETLKAQSADKTAADSTTEAPKPEPGTLEINHDGSADDSVTEDEVPEERPQIHVDDNGRLSTLGDKPPEIDKVRGITSDGTPTESGATAVKRERITEPPQMNGGDLTANSEPEALDPPTEELSLPSLQAPPLLRHNESVLPDNSPVPALAPQPAPAGWQPPSVPPIDPDATLTEIEQEVDSPHLAADAPEAAPADQASAEPSTVDDARDAVQAAYNNSASAADPLQPIAALNAQPLGPELRTESPAATPTAPAPFVPPTPLQPAVSNTGFSEPTPGNSPDSEALDMPLPPRPFTPSPSLPPASSPSPSAFPGLPATDGQGSGPTPPPPVPPPMLPTLQ